MQYGHLPMNDRRDSALDSNGSTPFQTHQSLGQALTSHLNPNVSTYSRPTDSYRNPSTPPGLAQNAPPQQHPSLSTSHSQMTYMSNNQGSPALKRKHIDGAMGAQVQKRRREPDDADGFDIDGGGQGAKHWTDDEKSKLFNWLMGPGQDAHWTALRATKNSCLRECANDIFGSKKTYQALKGCYERNFNLFKQIYAFEAHYSHTVSATVASLSEADRLREYEKRLQAARKAGCDVGNITARTIDHWRRLGWYDLFYRRWHGDPATTRPVQQRAAGAGVSVVNSGAIDDTEGDEDGAIDFTDSIHMGNGLNGIQSDRSQAMNFLNPQNIRESHPLPSPVHGMNGTSTNANTNYNPTTNGVGASATTTNVNNNTTTNNTLPQPPPPPPPAPIPQVQAPQMTPTSPSDQPLMNLTITQGMVTAYMQFLQVQTQTGKLKMEYLRRKEEREERESAARRDLERMKLEREAAELEHTKHSNALKHKTDRAIELLANPAVDPSVKQAAGDFLKRLFSD
ncbi:hypothetical protein AX16_002415 [Volvariella volvacea WC 439]|nr:hypothetical protein AX16_002415 [Volvariella volvacea WC 439]